MGIVRDATRSVGQALASRRAGVEKLVSRQLSLDGVPRLSVSSASFRDDGPLPTRFTTDGEGTTPSLEWRNPPASTQSFAVICEDPDAPFPEPFVHWIVYGIDPNARSLDARRLALANEGRNSKLTTGYAGASPPPGHGPHHYHFQVFALDVPPSLEPGAGRTAVVDAIHDHVIAWGEVVGVYERR